MVALLIDHGAAVDKAGEDGRSPLYAAALVSITIFVGRHRFFFLKKRICFICWFAHCCILCCDGLLVKKKNNCCENERTDTMVWRQCWLIAALMLTIAIKMEKRRFLLQLRCVNFEDICGYFVFRLVHWRISTLCNRDCVFSMQRNYVTVWSQGYGGSVDWSRRCDWQTCFQWQNAAFCCSRGAHLIIWQRVLNLLLCFAKDYIWWVCYCVLSTLLLC